MNFFIAHTSFRKWFKVCNNKHTHTHTLTHCMSYNRSFWDKTLRCYKNRDNNDAAPLKKLKKNVYNT